MESSQEVTSLKHETTAKCIEDLPKHPHIPVQFFLDVYKKFCAIDNTLQLHYTNHTVDPLLTKILDSAATLAQRRIKVSDIECILLINPRAYVIFKSRNSGYYDFSQIWVKFPSNFKKTMIQTRKAAFINDLDIWIRQNQETASLIHANIADIIKRTEKEDLSSRPPSPSKVTKPAIQKKPSISDQLKNDISKFMYQERNENKEQQKNNGLSLLERIKLKEKLKKEQTEREVGTNTPEVQYQKYLTGKLPSVYEILYQLGNNNRGPTETWRTFSLLKLTATIIDSLDYPMDTQEVEDVLRLMERKLGDKLVIIRRDKVSAVKVGGFNREHDLDSISK